MGELVVLKHRDNSVFYVHDKRSEGFIKDLKSCVPKIENKLQSVPNNILRDCHVFFFQTDFLLVVMRDMINAFPDLRVVLMSATIDTSLFVEYFGHSRMVEVYGRVHPVQGQ